MSIRKKRFFSILLATLLCIQIFSVVFAASSTTTEHLWKAATKSYAETDEYLCTKATVWAANYSNSSTSMKAILRANFGDGYENYSTYTIAIGKQMDANTSDLGQSAYAKLRLSGIGTVGEGLLTTSRS